MACPDWRRLVHASVELLNCPSSLESVRTPFDPSAWQDWHEFLRVSIQACCDLDNLADAVSLVAGAGKFAGGGDLEQRIPVDAGIIFRRRGGVRRRDRREIHELAGRALNFRQIDQPITTHPEAVVGLGKIGNDIAAALIGHHHFGKFGGEVGRLRDHPDAGLGPGRSSDDATEIAVADVDCWAGLICPRRDHRHGHQRRCRNRPRTDQEREWNVS